MGKISTNSCEKSKFPIIQVLNFPKSKLSHLFLSIFVLVIFVSYHFCPDCTWCEGLWQCNGASGNDLGEAIINYMAKPAKKRMPAECVHIHRFGSEPRGLIDGVNNCFRHMMWESGTQAQTGVWDTGPNWCLGHRPKLVPGTQLSIK